MLYWIQRMQELLSRSASLADPESEAGLAGGVLPVPEQVDAVHIRALRRLTPELLMPADLLSDESVIALR